MIGLLIALAVLAAIFVVIVVLAVKAEKPTRWEEHLWETEAKELEELDILFEDIWDEVEK